MCGRFEQSSPAPAIQEAFGVATALLRITPGYNIAPSREVSVIISSSGGREVIACRWGFVPSWYKGPASGCGIINARSDSVATKPAFRASFRSNRCLVPADGFYEWRHEGKKKVPYYIHLKSGGPFGFAGLFSRRTTDAGEDIYTCAIITTEANALVSRIHHRMPAILTGEDMDLWLSPGLQDPDALMQLLKPYPAGAMDMHEVSTLVNFPGHDSPEIKEPVAASELPGPF